MRIQAGLLAICFILPVSLGGCAGDLPVACSPAEISAGCAVTTELFFGLSRPGGDIIGEAEWRSFVDSTATALLPAGFTILDAHGQWRTPEGQILAEPSRLMIIVATRPGDDARITALISAYKERFSQQSVLRISFRSVARF